MSDGQVRVTFQPTGRAVFAMPGATVLEAAARCGLTIDTPCGGGGTCGKCRVQFTRGACAPGGADRRIFSEEELNDGWRLACQTRICGESVIRVPQSSLFADQHQIVTQTMDESAPEIQPTFRKVHVELAEPTLTDDEPDLLRLEKVVGPFDADLELLREVSGLLRSNAFTGTAVLADHRLIGFESGDTADCCFGVAFDIGTTTMVGSLLNLYTGEELAVVSRMNPQVSYGDDVLSRIKHSSSHAEALADLHRVVVTEVVRMIDNLCEEAKVSREYIYEVTFAGNTTMEHLLCGIDPTQLGQIPFVPVFGRGLVLPARRLDIPIHCRGMAYVFPVIGGFVGGDTVAGLLATRLAEMDGPTLMVDIGTNGEIALAHEGKLWAASTAAGPAFEGARISCGMRATAGAIEKVVLDGTVQCSVIGNAPAVGLCGSGLIDAVAEMLRKGVVSPVGRMNVGDDLPDDLPAAIASRARLDGKGEPMFVLAEGGPGRADSPVALTQRDIRELQLASGSIRAGINILLKNAGLTTADVRQVLIAGGFGSFIRRNNAAQIGLLPPEIDHSRIHYVGNVSLSGARWALLSTEARRQAETLARRTTHVELSTSADFQMEFAEAMVFPGDE